MIEVTESGIFVAREVVTIICVIVMCGFFPLAYLLDQSRNKSWAAGYATAAADRDKQDIEKGLAHYELDPKTGKVKLVHGPRVMELDQLRVPANVPVGPYFDLGSTTSGPGLNVSLSSARPHGEAIRIYPRE